MYEQNVLDSSNVLRLYFLGLKKLLMRRTSVIISHYREEGLKNPYLVKNLS